MRRHEIPVRLANAKRAAVEQFLSDSRPPAVPRTWAVRAHPQHNIVGVGLGRKIRRGKPTRIYSVRIYVERKIPSAAIPQEFMLPRRIENVVTDVVETGRFHAQLPGTPAGQQRMRPAKPGCSIGFQFSNSQNGELMAGTLGALVESAGVRYILSNNHVLANENALPIGTPIFQPGLLDGGNVASDSIATLAQFIPLSPTDPNTVDCAIAAVTNAGTTTSTFLPKVGRLASAEPIDAAEGMRVAKTGRATGYTTGTVFDVSATISIQFDLGMLKFTDQVLVRSDAGAFSDGGDSGSLVVDRATGRATGLLIGGVPQYAIANHLSDVLRALNATLVC
jgi:hypothetical protein